MKMKHLFVAASLFALSLTTAFGQTRTCGSTEHLNQQLLADPSMAVRMADIETFTNNFVASGQNAKAVVYIPVVVHVVYNTSAQNISDALIYAQIDQLNKDYARLNSDASSTPSVFQGVAANTNIQFCLAQRTPAGAATTGIVRKATTSTSFIDDDKVKFSAQGGDDAWDATKYLNLWVCNLGNSLLGYAQFPGGSASTDGVVVLYSSVGSLSTPGSASPYNYGRTATHEVGHWLNLRHIWGDANCGNDLVSDTPTQQTSNFGCPTFPHTTCSNGANGDMFMNYMDYTDDGCMNMFTAGQSTRMNALFATGGARVGLTTSLGCSAPSGTSCGTPTSLATASITSSSATISWAAVSGATGYTAQYRVVGAATWTNATVSGTSASLAGLAAATNYQWQVQANCSGTLGTFAASTFTTSSVATSCGNPSGLATANITSSSASISWAAVSGATAYNVQFRIVGSATWTTGTVTAASASLSGLTAASNYEWQVQANCNGTLSSFVAASFTTLASTTCTDTYEANESRTAAKTIATNTNISAKIGTSTDKDYFKFTTTTAAKNFKITLDNLPADYDLRLYNSSGTLLASSANGSTTAEVITGNGGAAGTYYIYVFGYNGAYNANSCYRLFVQTSASTLKTIEGADEEATTELQPIDVLSLYPNPNNGQFTVQLLSDNEGDANVRVFDLTGKMVMQQRFASTKGENRFTMDMMASPSGIYFVEVNVAGQRFVKKLIKE